MGGARRVETAGRGRGDLTDVNGARRGLPCMNVGVCNQLEAVYGCMVARRKGCSRHSRSGILEQAHPHVLEFPLLYTAQVAWDVH